MLDIETIGRDWIVSEVDNLTERVDHILPSEFNEKTRYLPNSVTSIPGYLRFSVNPFMREIVDCFDVNSSVREVNVKKGAQVTYTTALESGVLYYMAHVKTLPIMYMTADKELAAARIENNFIPMINQSDLGHIIRSSDEGNTRKTGKTAKHIQFEGGGYLVPFGALNANKMRSYSICILLKDEIDAWPDRVGKDGDPEKLSNERTVGYPDNYKIFRGSTPTIKDASKIEEAWLRGDQRKYLVLCKKCSFPQELRWSTKDGVGGFKWDYEQGTLVPESVRYCCQNCGAEHYEYDKNRLFSEKHGAHWNPTARPVMPHIRSYHLPALYSPMGMRPWYACVDSYLDGWDHKDNKLKDGDKYQVFYNNILAEPFEVYGSKVHFVSVSAHRRSCYVMGQIPNKFALEWLGGPVLFLTCLVDVHKTFLAVAVMGWCIDAKTILVDYLRFEVDNDTQECGELSCPVWGRLREVIEEKEYTADDGRVYRIHTTLIDAGYENDTVVSFCSDYVSGVYPILGRERPAKNQKIAEFDEFITKKGTTGYRILVDHYKDRIAPVLRREWPGNEIQKRYHFNAPVDIPDKALKELTVEVLRKKIDDRGIVSFYWHRPGNARNELWDCLVYGHASVEIIAWAICVQGFKLKTIDWVKFWPFMLDNLDKK